MPLYIIVLSKHLIIIYTWMMKRIQVYEFCHWRIDVVL